MGVTTSLLTFEEFERLPAEPGKSELLDGELIQLPPPKKRHTIDAHRLRDTLKPIVDQAAELGNVFVEAGYKLGRNTYLIPDVSITYPNQSGEEYFEGAPLLAVEIISESNTAEQVDRKIKKYLAHGSREVWVVYPKTRCVWIFTEGGAREFRGALRSQLLQGLEIDLEAILG